MAFIPLSPFPVQFQHSTTSVNLNNGELTFFLSGTSTATNLFSDSSGTSIGTSITLNSAGFPESGGNVITLFRDTTISYKIVLKLATGGTTVFTADTLNSELTILALTTNGNGASLVGVEDTAGNIAATDVEAAIAEMYVDFLQNVVGDMTPQLGGTLDCQDNIVQKPELMDYAITHTTPTISSGAITFDLAVSNSFDVSLTENITAITISNPPATSNRGSVTIVFVQDGTGSRTVAGWPAAVKWPGGTAPTITTTLTTGTDMITLTTHDAGTTWLGNFSQDYS